MNKTIDTFSNLEGWVNSGLNVDLTFNQFTALVYEGGGSLRVKVEKNARNSYFEKDYGSPIDIKAMNDFRFVAQRWSKTMKSYKSVADFSLKVALGRGAGVNFTALDEWYVPIEVYREWNLVNIDISHLDEFQTIRFTVLDDAPEIYFIDNLLLVKDEPIIDLLMHIQNELNHAYRMNLGKLGTTASAGAGGITLPDWANVTRHSVIVIEEGDTSETHQVNSAVSDNGKIIFGAGFDGSLLINSFTSNADIYLTVPCQIINKYMRYAEPGLTLSGFVANPEMFSSHTVRLDSYKVSGRVGEIRDFRDITVPINIVVTCEQPELMVLINEFIQSKFHDDYQVGINGFKYDLLYEGNDFDQGTLEEESDQTLHRMNVYMTAPFGVKRKYRDWPVTPNLNTTFGENK